MRPQRREPPPDLIVGTRKGGGSPVEEGRGRERAGGGNMAAGRPPAAPAREAGSRGRTPSGVRAQLRGRPLRGEEGWEAGWSRRPHASETRTLGLEHTRPLVPKTEEVKTVKYPGHGAPARRSAPPRASRPRLSRPLVVAEGPGARCPLKPLHIGGERTLKRSLTRDVTQLLFITLQMRFIFPLREVQTIKKQEQIGHFTQSAKHER